MVSVQAEESGLDAQHLSKKPGIELSAYNPSTE